LVIQGLQLALGTEIVHVFDPVQSLFLPEDTACRQRIKLTAISFQIGLVLPNVVECQKCCSQPVLHLLIFLIFTMLDIPACSYYRAAKNQGEGENDQWPS